MRYFWSLIALLVVATAALYGARTAGVGGSSSAAEPSDPAPAAMPSFGRPAPSDAASEPAETPTTAADDAVGETLQETRPLPVPSADRVVSAAEPALEPAGELASASAESDSAVQPVAAEPQPPVAAEPDPAEPASSFSLDELLGVVAEAAEKSPQPEPEAQSVVAAEPAAEPDPMLAAAAAAVSGDANRTAAAPANEPAAPAEPEGPVGPAYTVAGDGSIRVEGVGVIPGAGTAQRPFVLDWDVLRSLSREFNPRQGQDKVPGWVMELHGKRVRVEGNTLLPVVAQTTNELLVMQNPWDGCCLGVPPTPYDAIEVKLARMQRMGNSPTGYGMVEGVFKVDPYIVSGWLLGLYVIDDASFESGAGIALPEI